MFYVGQRDGGSKARARSTEYEAGELTADGASVHHKAPSTYAHSHLRSILVRTVFSPRMFFERLEEAKDPGGNTHMEKTCFKTLLFFFFGSQAQTQLKVVVLHACNLIPNEH